MMLRANFRAEEGALSTQERALNEMKIRWSVAPPGKYSIRFISTERRNSHEQLRERLAITHYVSRLRGSAQRQASAARCGRRAWSARSHSEHARHRACRPPTAARSASPSHSDLRA